MFRQSDRPSTASMEPAGRAVSVDSAFRDAAQAAPRRRLRSEDVLRGAREVEIVHGGMHYRLSVTSMGKLILTK